MVSPEESLPNIHYYDPVRHWRRIKRHLKDPELNDILVTEFNKYTFVRWGWAFTHDRFPDEYESCDWRCQSGRRGRRPTYWRYVKHGACHWLVNFNLKLAQLVEPKRAWRIVTSEKHSTVWDGAEALFDLNFLALGIPPEEAFELASDGGEELMPGVLLETHFVADSCMKITSEGSEFVVTGEEESCGQVRVRKRDVRKTRQDARKLAAFAPASHPLDGTPPIPR